MTWDVSKWPKPHEYKIVDYDDIDRPNPWIITHPSQPIMWSEAPDWNADNIGIIETRKPIETLDDLNELVDILTHNPEQSN